MKKVYLLKGLDCPVCASKVEAGLNQDSRIIEAHLSYPSCRLSINSKQELSNEELMAIINPLEEGLSLGEYSSQEKNEEGEKFKQKIILLFIRIAVGLGLALTGLFYLNEANFGLWPNLVINLVAYLILGYDVLYKAVINPIKNHEFFDENTLMGIATIGAFCLRFFGEASNEFFEAVMVVLFYQVGEVFNNFALRRSHNAVLNAVGLKAKVARKVSSDGSIIEVTPEEIEVGDILKIRVGDLLPVDGIIVNGEGSLDTSSLTGEFLPLEASHNTEVKASYILLSGSLEMRASKTYEDSSVAKILSLLEESAEHKSKVDRFISKFARFYTPIVMLLSILIMVVPPLFMGINDMAVWERFIYSGLCALVISCPCAIVISVPLSFFSGIGLASKAKMVVRGSEHFDTLNQLKVLCVDKTGTLTEGKFQIAKVETSLKEEEFLYYLRATESLSSHPIATAILAEHKEEFSNVKLEGYEEVAGKGIHCHINNKQIYAGNATYLTQNGVQVPVIKDAEGTLVHLAIDGVYAGYVELVDTIKESSYELVKGCHKLGIRIVLLSGDNPKNVEALASKLGLDEYHGGLTPEDKREYIISLKQKYGKLAYIGDGINDAPSIKEADIGFAMGNRGSDLAIENSDVLLMEDDPSKFIDLIKISRKTTNNAIMNIVISLVVKVGVMILSLIYPSFPLYIAVLADTGILALLVLNSLSLLLIRVKK